MELEEIKDKLNKATVKKESIQTLLDERTNRLNEIKKEVETLLKSQVILQEVATEVQSKLSLTINSIINLGLATIFGDEYKFELNYVPARGKTEVEFVLLQNGKKIDPMLQCGGGLVDVVCFCLRVAIYSIGKTSNTMVYDEAMKFLSKGFREKAAELIHTLSEKLNLQFIEVTHISEFMENSDNQIILKKINGVSEIL